MQGIPSPRFSYCRGLELNVSPARLQYRNARYLTRKINVSRPRKEILYRHCLNKAAYACFAPIRFLDWLRNLASTTWTRNEQRIIREARFQAATNDVNFTWTTGMAFYALSGGCIHRSGDGETRILDGLEILELAEKERKDLVPLQRAVLQGPGKVGGIAKAVTCIQALWFCSQSISRISEDLAISLLELNTFAHCVSTLIIYLCWWDKPYEAESHVWIESPSLSLKYLLLRHHPTLSFYCVHGPLLKSSQRPHHLATGQCTVSDERGRCLFSTLR